MPTHSSKTILLATDLQNSVLNALVASQPHPIVYTPYGHCPRGSDLLNLLGFNGELPDPMTGHYHLGRGYRQFNPVLMRFNSPDSCSPFGEGGLNIYAYCGGDPRNRSDPTGHVFGLNTALKSTGMGISKQSKVISKSASISKHGRRAANASSTSIEAVTPASGSSTTASSATKIAEINNAVARINTNEPIAEIIGNYTNRVNTPDMTISANHYGDALKNYPFIPLRQNQNVFVPDVGTPRWTNAGQLDVHHFDVSISLFRNVAAFRNQKIPGDGRRLSILADVQEIRRANYIRTHTGINLLR
ncbi:RHS repeat-associated core domain-containing protein [Pseudomonas izuensis]|uniref:RHS repeat-associated core domain-containing protein n=1 Tax=Pseudomonas izuensis TaxID=2684212 RepID=UPI001358337D|nr:RHS repeat-associated core domain-containing protein [Pseudomonas izuensis]